jgi:hypothetical protein
MVIYGRQKYYEVDGEVELFMTPAPCTFYYTRQWNVLRMCYERVTNAALVIISRVTKT